MEWGLVQYPGIAQPVGDPSEWVEQAYYEAWQNQPTTLMPIYDPRFIGGDVGNWPYFLLQLFPNTHFGPNATGDFAEPTTVDIIVKPGTLEIRRPL